MNNLKIESEANTCFIYHRRPCKRLSACKVHRVDLAGSEKSGVPPVFYQKVCLNIPVLVWLPVSKLNNSITFICQWSTASPSFSVKTLSKRGNNSIKNTLIVT